MRRCAQAAVLALGIRLLAPPAAWAEEAASPPALHAGATSVELALNTFGRSGLGTIAVRRHFSPGWAVRLALDVNLASTNETDRTTEVDGSGYFLGQNGRMREASDQLWRISAQALWYPIRSDGFAFGFGLGPTYQRAHSESNDFIVNPPGYSTAAYSRVDETSSHRTGGAIDANLEWFVHRRVAIRGRTGFDFGWSTQSQTSVYQNYNAGGIVLNTETDELQRTGFDLSTVTFGLGLVAYF